MSDCQNCEHKQINNDPNLHCYMFKEAVQECAQYRPIDAQKRKVHVGTIGHIGPNRHARHATLLGALLAFHTTGKDGK